LVSLVARQFGISPYRLREVLEELDSLLQLATQKKNCGADEHPVEEAVIGYSLPNLSSEQSLSSSIDTEQEQVRGCLPLPYAPIHLFIFNLSPADDSSTEHTASTWHQGGTDIPLPFPEFIHYN
jgi:hypothetical protein